MVVLAGWEISFESRKPGRAKMSGLSRPYMSYRGWLESTNEQFNE